MDKHSPDTSSSVWSRGFRRPQRPVPPPATASPPRRNVPSAHDGWREQVAWLRSGPEPRELDELLTAFLATGWPTVAAQRN